MLQFKLPTIYGTIPTEKNIIYFSCDEHYYNEYGIALIKSIINQINWVNVHCHIIAKDNVDFLLEFPKTTYTYEYITEDFLNTIPFKDCGPIGKYNLTVTPEILYYSCARFMQIDKIFNKEQHVLQIDCDSLLYQPIPYEQFLWVTSTPRAMRKPKSPDKIIASMISFGTGKVGQDFRKTLADNLTESFSKNAYWYIDQEKLKEEFDKTDFEPIPYIWNSWNLKKRTAYFKTAKGNKKSNEDFINEINYWKNYQT